MFGNADLYIAVFMVGVVTGLGLSLAVLNYYINRYISKEIIT